MDKPTSTPLVRWIFLALDGELKQKTEEPSSSCSWLRATVYLATGYNVSVDRNQSNIGKPFKA
ncbi:hypothetical protein Taro_019693 [Colocasia esculenta]|uniref:Uncharacterized protein n=1 Tax=Colocasia esculenta TaxID=4460 RepID=A0A843UWY3_COLES|nr:hypothetical protein [Colocasia esculenta]